MIFIGRRNVLTNIQQIKRRVGKTIETISVFYKKQCTYHPQMVKYEGKPRSNKVKNGTLGELTDNATKLLKSIRTQDCVILHKYEI